METPEMLLSKIFGVSICGTHIKPYYLKMSNLLSFNNDTISLIEKTIKDLNVTFYDIKQFKNSELISRGAFANVYRAKLEDPNSNINDVVLKVFTKGDNDNESIKSSEPSQRPMSDKVLSELERLSAEVTIEYITNNINDSKSEDLNSARDSEYEKSKAERSIEYITNNVNDSNSENSNNANDSKTENFNNIKNDKFKDSNEINSNQANDVFNVAMSEGSLEDLIDSISYSLNL
ncbi:13808_t:CDS:2 [Dentiscutata erythropus]|uniref:13808_t:CDS:1 n=1 Tax=Dentiscutata erythropus TaxID=1348616 RepID=A0A9N8VF65_9GLOM|nr:13808_t:CDS:2 [Dentiscutata erythropus]